MNTFKYKVKLGDSLSRIAERYHVSVEEVAKLSGIKDVRILWIGQSLTIPDKAQSTTPPVGFTRPRAETGIRAGVSGPASGGKPITSPLPPAVGAGRNVRHIGRVRSREGVNLYDAPGGKSLRTLTFNTRLFVDQEISGDWYFVTLEDGGFGYVNQRYLSIRPPEPNAVLHEVKKGENALGIVKRYYKDAAISWGQDERYYVNVLVEANRSTGPVGVYKPDGGTDWSQTRTREGYLIWVPSLAFAQGLRSKVASGSISHEMWVVTSRAVEAVEDFLCASGAFVAGVLHGALESIWDLLTGLVDLIRLLWDIVKSVLTLEVLSDVKSLWELAKSLNVSALVDAGFKELESRWNDPSLLSRWHFRGWVIGYAIAEFLMAVVTGSATLVKWSGKAGKLSKIISRFPRVLKAAEKVTEVSRRIPEEVGKRVKRLLSEHIDAARSGEKPRVPWSGARYIEAVDAADAKKYEEIRNLVHDFQRMNKYTGVAKRVLSRVYTHLFHTIHEMPVGPNKVLRGHFTPDSEIAYLWLKATETKLTGDELRKFVRIVAHEYVESKLMEKGFPYRSSHSGGWKDGICSPNGLYHGAHDLAPLVNHLSPPFKHWETALKMQPPGILMDSDLSNLDRVVEDILKKKRGWNQ